MPVDVKYTAEATSTGGRIGRSSTPDGVLDLTLTRPRELGGDGALGANPEQLFAAGYSACFIGALQAAGREMKQPIPADTTVTARIGIGPRSEGGFGLTASLQITLPGLPPPIREALAQRAHEICPYSNATRGNLDVALSVA
jgi:osmotically inducible protein OsmC